jgi:hypothetical protein
MIVLLVVGFFAVGGVLFGIERLIDRRNRAGQGRLTRDDRSSRGTEAYGSAECYRDCIRTETPFSEGQHPSCAEACGLTR